MKKLFIILSACSIFLATTSITAQNITSKAVTKQQKKVEKQANFEKENVMSIETLNFSFTPTTVTPEFGTQHDISSLTPYFLVDKNSFSAQLPYMGNFYIQPQEPSQVPIDVTSTQFLYSVHTTDGVVFEVTIVPSDTVSILNQGIKFVFSLNKNTGEATLIVSAQNRSSITFSGFFNYN